MSLKPSNGATRTVAASRRPMRYWSMKLQAMGCLLVGHQTGALAVFDRMVAAWPDDRYARISRAHLLAAANRTRDAIADLRTVTGRESPPASAADWFNLGYLLESAGETGDSEQAFRRAVELDPKLDRAWYGLGLALIRLQRLDEAVVALKRNTELQPMSPYGWYQLARVQMDRREPDEAHRIIRHLKGFEPKVAAQLEREVGQLA